jgi:signal transduction histidine kinase/phage shock protein PspC (stress-responsive transcriptional regulator)
VDLTRRRQGRWLAGVCAGLAGRYALSLNALRAGTVVLAVIVGPPVVVAYAAAWAFLPDEEGGSYPARRITSQEGLGARSAGEAAAWIAIVVGILLVLAEISSWVPRVVLLPGFLACAGAAVVWGGRQGRYRPLRVALGVSMVLAGGFATLAAISDLRTIGRSAAGAAVVVVGLVLMLGPGLARLARSLSDERRQRIRSEERADVAAHLHDGVLQTLALIQKRAGDDKAVRSLARRQERELRSWLYGGTNGHADVVTVATLLRRELDDLEDHYAVRFEAVLVGDAPLDDAGRALVAAGREAALNAARHSGVETVDVYLEVEPDRTSLFVRDRGSGFDPGAVPPDRRGLADSIFARVRRHGGTAEVRSAPGEGAEIELSMPRATVRSEEKPH